MAFPDVPDRRRFNRLLRTVGPGLLGFSHHLVSHLQARPWAYEAWDTMGCAPRNVHRRQRGGLAGEAHRGFGNRIGGYDGLTLMTRVTPDGVITGFGCAPANPKAQPYAETRRWRGRAGDATHGSARRRRRRARRVYHRQRLWWARTTPSLGSGVWGAGHQSAPNDPASPPRAERLAPLAGQSPSNRGNRARQVADHGSAGTRTPPSPARLSSTVGRQGRLA
ncbi:MAG: hypothetical protein ACRDH2_02235 [Anaerolineales bacterium]